MQTKSRFRILMRIRDDFIAWKMISSSRDVNITQRSNFIHRLMSAFSICLLWAIVSRSFLSVIASFLSFVFDLLFIGGFGASVLWLYAKLQRNAYLKLKVSKIEQIKNRNFRIGFGFVFIQTKHSSNIFLIAMQCLSCSRYSLYRQRKRKTVAAPCVWTVFFHLMCICFPFKQIVVWTAGY